MAQSAVHRAIRTARAIRAVITQPPYVAPGHFYSPITRGADASRAMTWSEQAGQQVVGLDMREARQLELAEEFSQYLNQPLPGPRYSADNSQYGSADGAVYRAMLNYLKPARLIEVGSGYSTAVALDEADSRMPDLKVTCVEPYPERLQALLRDADRARLTLLTQAVQDVPMSIYEQLTSGDVLFIDSTHVVKAGSDVNWLFLHVLPRLQPGVVVHVHDVFWPFEYPGKWLNEHRDWTEDYLLHAFLIGNSEWEILWFSSWLWHCHPEVVPSGLASQEPGSIWLRRVG